MWSPLNSVFPLFTGKVDDSSTISTCLNPVLRTKFSRLLLDFIDGFSIKNFNSLEFWADSVPEQAANELTTIIEDVKSFREAYLEGGNVPKINLRRINHSIVMHPANNINEYGNSVLKIKDVTIMCHGIMIKD